jgi:aminoglycoside/choline kinase family phosphotransferase/dTDP-glucose pyrophosphorylase
MGARKAIVLAAGFGTRLRPFTVSTPKPLLPVWGVPMVERVVATLRSWGVDDIVVNCHHLAEQVAAWCAANGCRAAHEDVILGTGGVLNPLRNWIGDDDFYLVNGDIVFDGIDKCPFDDAPPTSGGLVGPDAVIGQCLLSEEGPRTVEADPDGIITCWKSPDPGWSGTFTYCGVARLKAKILDYVEPGGHSTIVQAYEKAMADGLFVVGAVPPGMMWTDAGTVGSYIDVNSSGDENAFMEIPQVKAAASAAKVPADAKTEFIGARGSDRCLFRAGDAVVIVYDDSKRGENAKYAGHAKWLASKGIPVPAVLADMPEIKTLAMSYSGSPRKMSFAEYAKVAEALADFNALDAAGLDLEPRFDAALWKWERDLFAEHCLGTRFATELPEPVAKELEKIALLLDSEPPALVHRDFQSENILWKDGAFTFIDFQGMRLGPAAYDLASLLYDPYAKISDDDRAALAAVYAKKCGRAGIAKILPYAAVQRLVQCLGAFGRLASVGQPQFSRHVLPALENLLSAADEAGLDATGALAEDLIAKETHRGHAHTHAHGHDCKCGCGGHHGEGEP